MTVNIGRGDIIRLRRDLDGLPSGMCGTVFGFYRRPEETTYVVLFGPEPRELTSGDFEVVEGASSADRAA